MSLFRATLYGLLTAFALPLAAGSLSLHVTNPTPSPWRIWATASLHLTEEGALAAPADGAGLQVPARGTLQVHLAWEDDPGRARPLFHAESVEAADALVWTLAPDRIPGGSVQWTLRLQAPSPELLLRSVADPVFLPSPAPRLAIPREGPDAVSDHPGDHPSPSPHGAPTEPAHPGGEGPASTGKDGSVHVYATLEVETRGSSRRITLLDVVRPPAVTRVPIQSQGTPDATEERCPWTREGRRRHLTLVPGYRYAIRVNENTHFARDPLIAYSRVMVLSGPGGLPWDAASLVGSREGAAGPGDPWRFRLRAPDALPGFQEVDGGRRNSFVFGPVEAGVVHGLTSFPIPERAGNPERKSVSGKGVRPQGDGDEGPKSTGRREGVLAEITVRNHLGSSCYLRADGVRRMRGRGNLQDLDGNRLLGSVRWGERTDRPDTSLFLEVPAGQAVHLAVDRNSRWGAEKRQRVLHLEVPGGTTGATLLAVQGNHPMTTAIPWRWFLRDTSGREAALLPGLELVDGSLLEIRPMEGPKDGTATRGESKQPLEDEWEEVVEGSGVAPLAGNGLPQDSGPGLLPMPTAVIPLRKPDAGSENRGNTPSPSPQDPPSVSSSSGDGPSPSGKATSSNVYANLEFETRDSSRMITLLDVLTPPMLTRMPIKAQGAPDVAEERCRWVREGKRRSILVVPGYRYFVKVKETAYFGRDPLIPYSRVLVLSGPDGTPWNAASLVGSRDGATGPGDPWRFRLRIGDTLPGFQAEAGGRRNSFVFGEGEAGVVHGVTSLPMPPQDGEERPAAPRKRVRSSEEGEEEASQTNKRKKGVLTEITVRNHAGRACFLRADDVKRMRSRQHLMDLSGNSLTTPVRWVRRANGPETSRFLCIPAGKAAHLVFSPQSRWGNVKQQRVLALEVPGGTTGATLLAIQGHPPMNGPAVPWKWYLRDTSGREAARVPGLELVRGSVLEISPSEGQGEADAIPGESKEPRRDGPEEAADSGAAPLAGDGPSSGSPGGGGRASVRKASGQPYAILEFETRGASRRITLLEVDRSPKLARRRIPEQGTPEETTGSCRWVAEGRRRHLDLAPGYVYSITITGNSYFARDPLIPFSRALVLSGPGGEPWNAATLVGWSNRVAGGDDGWHFRLRDTDALPGFQEDAGGGQNRFVFGPVEAGAVHGVTSFPIGGRDGAVDRQPSPGKRARAEEGAGEASKPSKQRNKVPAETTMPNPLGVPRILRAEDVSRTPPAGTLMDLALAATASRPATDDRRGERE